MEENVLIGRGREIIAVPRKQWEEGLAGRVPLVKARLSFMSEAPGFALGTLLAVVIALLPRRVAAGIGLVALSALVALVAHAPADPYFAHSLQAWEQGRFIRFHGAAQWIGWLWPYAALVHLLVRAAARGDDGSRS